MLTRSTRTSFAALMACVVRFIFMFLSLQYPAAADESRLSAELSVWIVNRTGDNYWSRDPELEECCKPLSSGTLDLGYELRPHLGLLFELTNLESLGLLDPVVGVTYDFATSNNLKWSGAATLSLPTSSDSKLSKRQTAAFASIKPSWTRRKWTSSLETSYEIHMYSGPIEDDEPEEETVEPVNTAAAENTDTYDVGRISTVFTSGMNLEYAWLRKIAVYCGLKESIYSYSSPSATRFWTELSMPGMRYHLEHVQWLLETKWSGAGKGVSAPYSLAVVLGLVADIP